MKTLVFGYSTRWFVELALAGGSGLPVAAADGFCDLDFECMGVPAEPFLEGRAPKALSGCDRAVYLGGAEHDIRTLLRIAGQTPLCNTSPQALLALARLPQVFQGLKRAGFPLPETRFSGRVPGPGWLLKPFRSGGGVNIRRCGAGPIPRGRYAQRETPGESASLSFLADGANCAALGYTRQLIGDKAFFAPDFAYAGNVTATPPEPARSQALDMARYLTGTYGLKGLCCLDFLVLPDDTACFLELNPRPGAGAELFREMDPVGLHLSACYGELSHPPVLRGVRGKAILYAAWAGTAPENTPEWYLKGVRDVPRPGSPLQKGRPVCTVLAAAATQEECCRALRARAGEIAGELGYPWDGEDAERMRRGGRK